MPAMRQNGTYSVDFTRQENGRNPMSCNSSSNEPTRFEIWIKRETPIKSKQEHGFPSRNQERNIVHPYAKLVDANVRKQSLALQ